MPGRPGATCRLTYARRGGRKMRGSSMKTALAVLVVAIACAGMSAQATPDLSGRWVADAAKSDAAPAGGGRGRGNPNEMVIARADDTITVTVGGANYIYNL